MDLTSKPGCKAPLRKDLVRRLLDPVLVFVFCTRPPRSLAVKDSEQEAETELSSHGFFKLLEQVEYWIS